VSRIAYVSGRLGAGKSSLGPLAAELGYSLVTKDLIKETLHDALFVPGGGEIDRAWSQRLGAASFELLWMLAARAGDMVIEANFHPHSELELGKLRGVGDRTVEVHCACPGRGRGPGDGPPDQHPLDLRRALEDREDPGGRGSFHRSAACLTPGYQHGFSTPCPR
jgi:hypothetical protein